MTAPYNPSPAGSFLEGLTGGFESGYGFRTGMQDRRRRQEREDEATTEAKARALREAVGFELSQRVQNTQLERWTREQAEAERIATERGERQAALRASAARIREQYGRDPNYRAITLLPDEEMVQRFGAAAERVPVAERERRTATAAQVTEARRDVRDAKAGAERAGDNFRQTMRARPEKDPLTGLPLPDSAPALVNWRADSTDVARRRETADREVSVAEGALRRLLGQGETPEPRGEALRAQYDAALMRIARAQQAGQITPQEAQAQYAEAARRYRERGGR